ATLASDKRVVVHSEAFQLRYTYRIGAARIRTGYRVYITRGNAVILDKQGRVGTAGGVDLDRDDVLRVLQAIWRLCDDERVVEGLRGRKRLAGQCCNGLVFGVRFVARLVLLRLETASADYEARKPHVLRNSPVHECW